MSVLVTGGSGLIGKYLKEIAPDWTYVSSKDFNLVSQRETSLMIAQEQPTHVIHMAAKVGGIISNQKYPCDYYEENTLINSNIVRACRINDVKRFTGIISTCAYPDVSESYPLKEESLFEGPPAKSNFAYGMAKRSLAAHINACNEQYGTNYNYIIPCNLYGNYDNYSETHSHYVAALIRKIYNAYSTGANEIELFGTGAPLRQFMYAGDMAQIIKRMVEENITHSFNAATPETRSIKDIAIIALYSLGLDMKINFNSAYPDGQYRKDASIEKFKEFFPDFEFTTLEKGIKSTFEYYSKLKVDN